MVRTVCMRKPRVLERGARFHVSGRANRKEMILDSPGMKACFLDVIVQAKKRFAFSIENFCIMGNHYHLIIRPGLDENLSKIMQWILSVFAMRFNRLHGLSGHVWGERFFSRILHSIGQYLMTFEYIDKNPVEANLVRSPDRWVFSGRAHRIRGYYGVVDPLPVYLATLLPERSLLRISC